jgi:signal transduction histidine kinase
LGVVQDITDQKEMERQKDNFLGIASHELKTPVTSVKGYTQFLERKFRKLGDNASADLLGKMNIQVDRLSVLISDLLDVTKMNNGRIQFNAKPFDFNQMVEEVIDEMQRTSEKHHIGRQLTFKGTVNSDRERIYQVVVNLISNAIKYSPESNRIIVYTEDHGNEVQLCVQDFGIGISRDKKDKVFEQFYRVSGTKEHTFPGLGLGLYISSEIVKRMNGRIWVSSTEGKGSTFCFAIPVQIN